MKIWQVLALLAILAVAALIIANIWGGTTAPFYVVGALVLLLCIFLLSAVKIGARGRSYREFMNMNLMNAGFYTAIEPVPRQAKKEDEKELPPLHFEEHNDETK